MATPAVLISISIFLIVFLCTPLLVESQYFNHHQRLSPQDRSFLLSSSRAVRSDVEDDNDEENSFFYYRVWSSMEKLYPSLARLLGGNPKTTEEQREWKSISSGSERKRDLDLRRRSPHAELPTMHDYEEADTDAMDEKKRQTGSSSRPCNNGFAVNISTTEPPTTVCKCPLDKIGKKCETSRPVVCEWLLLSPLPKCAPLGKDSDLLDSDPVCFVFAMSESIEWKYNLSCRFADETSPDFVDDEQFIYYARTRNSFAISKATADSADPQLEAIQKVFNFNILSDKNASQVVRLSAAQLEGKASVSFNLSLPNIAAKYFAGGRLYFEVSLYTERHPFPGLFQKRYDRRFVDPIGAPRRYSIQTGVSFWSIFRWILLALVVIGSLFGAFIYLRRRRAKRLKRLRQEKDR